MTQHFEPRLRQMKLAMLADLMKFNFRSDSVEAFEKALIEWEHEVRRYALVFTKTVGEELKIAIILESCPDDLKQFLSLTLPQGEHMVPQNVYIIQFFIHVSPPSIRQAQTSNTTEAVASLSSAAPALPDARRGGMLPALKLWT